MIKRKINKAIEKLACSIGRNILVPRSVDNETALIATGAMLSNQQWSLNSKNMNDYEFRIFSQFGDDGIIQYLIKNIRIENKTFIEFGVEDYSESNTRFLMMNNNWSGFVMDSSAEAIGRLKKQHWFWKYDLRCEEAFVNKDNINNLLECSGYSNIGILHIDIDGNDYHVFNAIDLTKLNPSIIILEYNSIFGNIRMITIPYAKDFNRTKAHYSNLYFGASLPAIDYIASRKGYSLTGCNLAGNNAYFIRNDLLNEKFVKRSVGEAYKESKFRECRDASHSLTFYTAEERIKLIKGLDVLNVVTNKIETF